MWEFAFINAKIELVLGVFSQPVASPWFSAEFQPLVPSQAGAAAAAGWALPALEGDNS